MRDNGWMDETVGIQYKTMICEARGRDDGVTMIKIIKIKLRKDMTAFAPSELRYSQVGRPCVAVGPGAA